MKTKTKRILIAPLVVVAAIVAAHATTMCMQSDTVAIILDPDVEPTTYTYNEANKTWDVTAPYGHLTGIAVCNSTAGSWATPTSTDFPTGTSGVYCWCKMLRPARSAWVYGREYGSASACASRCADYCGGYVRIHGDFRRGVFSSAGD